MIPYRMLGGFWIDLSSIQIIHAFPFVPNLDGEWWFKVELAFRDTPLYLSGKHRSDRESAKYAYDDLVEAWKNQKTESQENYA